MLIYIFLQVIHSVYVTISYAFNTCFFLAKEKKSNEKKKENSRKEKKMKETNTTKEDFMILMYVTMRVVRLCNT
jgi:hypothetical protein